MLLIQQVPNMATNVVLDRSQMTIWCMITIQTLAQNRPMKFLQDLQGNNGCMNVPQCHIICTLPVLLIFISWNVKFCILIPYVSTPVPSHTHCQPLYYLFYVSTVYKCLDFYIPRSAFTVAVAIQHHNSLLGPNLAKCGVNQQVTRDCYVWLHLVSMYTKALF